MTDETSRLITEAAVLGAIIQLGEASLPLV